MARACVLVVEDERKIRDLLRAYLEREGLSVLTTGSGAEAIALLRSARPDLVVLDLGLPDVPGEEVAQQAVEVAGVPVVMLTARADVDDRVRGLRRGAADYVTKPFSPREVVLRVTGILARTTARPQARASSFGGGLLAIDEERRAVRVDGRPVELTPTEWNLLIALAQAPGRVHGRTELVQRIRPAAFDGYERIIDTHVKNLRRKLAAGGQDGADGADGEDCADGEGHVDVVVIETVLGAGYRLALPLDPVPDPPGGG